MFFFLLSVPIYYIAYSCQKLADAKRFFHIIIGAIIKGFDLFCFIVTSRNHDDGNLRKFP